MIVGELEKNYMQINEMAEKLGIEQQDNGTLKEKLALLDADHNDELNLDDFEYICSIIDDRRALISKYEKNLKTQKTLIAESSYFKNIEIELEINNIENEYRKTLCPVPLNNRDPFNFERGLDKEYIGFRKFKKKFINSFN